MGNIEMDQLTQRIKSLQNKVTRKKNLEDMIADLENERAVLEEKENILESLRDKEQTDVNKLKGLSLSSVYYSITGRKEEQLQKESKEAYVASVKYERICTQLKTINQGIQRYEEELEDLSSCEGEYKQLLNEKKEIMKKTDSLNGPKIFKLENELSALKKQGKELNEAYSIGKSVINKIHSITQSLDSAEGWGTWDLLGGGLVSNIAKHSHLDEAEQEIQQLQTLLEKYKEELEDVKIQSEVHAKVSGFLYFADFFFDGIFADWTVLNHIQTSQNKIEDIHKQVRQMQKHLDDTKKEIQNKIQQTQEKLEQVILN